MVTRVVLVVSSVAAALLAPASAGAASRALPSPSGKLACAFYSDAGTPRLVRCEWEGSNDRTITLAESGKGRRVRISGTVRDPAARKLAYSMTTKFGAPRCTSGAIRITCRSTRSGHGFTVSVEKQWLF